MCMTLLLLSAVLEVNELIQDFYTSVISWISKFYYTNIF